MKIRVFALCLASIIVALATYVGSAPSSVGSEARVPMLLSAEAVQTAASAAELARLIVVFEARVKGHTDALDYLFLGKLYLQRARSTGDLGSYTQAGAALERSLALYPSDPDALAALARLRYATHDSTAATTRRLEIRRVKHWPSRPATTWPRRASHGRPPPSARSTTPSLTTSGRLRLSRSPSIWRRSATSTRFGATHRAQRGRMTRSRSARASPRWTSAFTTGSSRFSIWSTGEASTERSPSPRPRWRSAPMPTATTSTPGRSTRLGTTPRRSWRRSARWLWARVMRAFTITRASSPWRAATSIGLALSSAARLQSARPSIRSSRRVRARHSRFSRT